MADYASVYAGYNDDPTSSGPSGIPDPNNPGYDTHGFPLDNSSAPTTEYPGGTPGEPNTYPVPKPTSQPGAPGPAAPPPGPGKTQPDAPPPPSAGTGSGTGDLGSTGAGLLAPFSDAAPTLERQPAFSPLTFKPPSIGEAMDDKAWQWQRDQTLSGLNRWAAYKGTLNDSGTGQAFLELGNNIANQRLGDVWSRANTEYQNNEGANERAYGINRQSQFIDPYTALFNAYTQRGNWYYQNQGNATNALLGFGNQLT